MINVFYAPNSLFTPESEIIYAKAMAQVDDGIKDIIIVSCAGVFSCSINPLGIRSLCCICKNKGDKYFAMFEKYSKDKSINLTRKIISNSELAEATNLANSDIKSITYKKSDIGYASLSTYIGFTRDYEPDITKVGPRKTINKLLNTAIKIHEWFDNFYLNLKDKHKSECFIFNGRLNNTRPALRVITSHGVDCICLELAGIKDKIVEYKNTLPHDILENFKLINKLYYIYSKDCEKIAREYYTSKLKGKSINDRSYISNQIEAKLPNGFDEKYKNIVIFGSSEDELKAIGKEWEMGLFKDQVDAVINISELAKKHSFIKLYFRVHPNVKTTPKKYRNRISNLCSHNVTVIEAESDISSYALLRKADVVITFGSTIGIEAAYWGKPSILIGKSFYSDVGSTYNPKKLSEIEDLITNNLNPLPIEGACKMAIFYTLNGYSNPYLKGSVKNGYSINGKKINLKISEKIKYMAIKFLEKIYIKLQLN